ncbi:hypothetical protein L7F22_062482 [Adiantum nelumboides]|nr:hypothetical protein [Adiantum nelumboides]
MNGAKARRFFKKMSKSPMQVSKASVDLTNDKRWELWKDLCLCTTNKDPNVEVANQRKLVWSSFQKVVQLMNLLSTTIEQQEVFKKVLYEFTKAAKDGWSQSKITHYMCGSMFYDDVVQAEEVGQTLEQPKEDKENDEEFYDSLKHFEQNDDAYYKCFDNPSEQEETQIDVRAVMERVAGKEAYRFLDGYSGYNQIKIALENQAKIAFITKFGVFAFWVMAFGLTNAPATFQR